jgi:DNA-binding transcriptional MerR regulator
VEQYRHWSGNLEDLGTTATSILTDATGQSQSPLSTRLLRDYVTRGLLGDASRKGRELLFTYDNLLRLVVARILLADGWMLAKILEHFSLSSTDEIEELFPARRSDALATLSRLKREATSQWGSETASAESFTQTSISESHMPLSKKMAQNSSVQIEMREALMKLGISENGPATEDLKLIAIAPWFQALVQSDRLRSLTRQEAEDIGAGVTAALTTLILKRGHGHD